MRQWSYLFNPIGLPHVSMINMSFNSFNVLMYWCYKARNFNDARKAMEDLKELGVEPDELF